MLDIGVILILCFGVFTGIRQGFSKAIFALIGWSIALIFSIQYYKVVAPFMVFISHDVYIKNVCAFLVICLGVVFLSWFLGNRLHQLFSFLKLGFLDHFLGGCFGLLKNTFIILVLLQTIEPWVHTTAFWKTSKTAPMLMPYAPLVISASKNIAHEAIQHFHEGEKRKESSLRHAGSALNVTENPFH